MSEIGESKDAKDILSEFSHTHEPDTKHDTVQDADKSAPSREKCIIFIGSKSVTAHVTETLTRLASCNAVTITAKGRSITEAVDVSQIIMKGMDVAGYVVSDVRISSAPLESQDGRERNISVIEIDIAKPG